MENKRKALGKGLEQLFSNESLYVDPIEEIIETTPKENVVEINIKELRSNGLSYREISKETSWSKATICRVLNGMYD